MDLVEQYFLLNIKKGKLKVINEPEKALHFIFSKGCGFEHLSV